ncbi:MAG: DDE-type integrase/transposase/recombinase [Spirochaetes bacterium]|nr:DDE-type integrase/transposase/recombinase [Spirochaetota bacterium]
MKKHFEDPENKHVPIYVVAWRAIRDKALSVSVATWYNYARILGYSRHALSYRRPRRHGIRAAKPGEIVHADVTIFRPRDNTRVYIYIIIDNFLRKILGWHASMSAHAGEFISTLENAFTCFIKPKLHAGEQSILMVDDGSESNNETVQHFLDGTHGALRKLVAQKDIIFSNSMIEAFNKVLKYRHLFHHDIPDYNGVVKHLNGFIHEYNSRPHCAHQFGRTPDEVFDGKNPPITDIAG